MEKCDVAINIFAKPYQTSLSILSLIKMCQEHINTLWLQFEPVGSCFDTVSPYTIISYLKEKKLVDVKIFQPKYWLGRNVADRSRFEEEDYRLSLRFEYAMEYSKSRYLFVMHNDVFIQKDIVGDLLSQIGDAFAIGSLGQCWNCPAGKEDVVQRVLHRSACTPQTYQSFQPSFAELQALYAEADKGRYFKRSYSDDLVTHFASQPWPLPECRINEWACLIDLQKTRPLTIPFGNALPFGAFEQCGNCSLDIGVSWFRAMHAHGLFAKHVAIYQSLVHFVGTGHKSRLRYTQAEDKAKRLLRVFFPDFLSWLDQSMQKNGKEQYR